MVVPLGLHWFRHGFGSVAGHVELGSRSLISIQKSNCKRRTFRTRCLIQRALQQSVNGLGKGWLAQADRSRLQG